MPSGMPDSSPSNKAGYKNRDKMSTKNKDGREGPLEGPKTAPFNDKKVDVMPNEGAPSLSKKGVIGKVI